MAVTTTDRFGVTRWSSAGDKFTRSQMDSSHASIEAVGVIYLHGTLSNRPTADKEGRFYYATDTNQLTYDDGSNWRDLLSPSTVTLTGTQTLTNKSLTAPTITGTIALPATTSIGTVTDTEISYLSGVTSGIQTQIDTKSPSASPTFTGTVTMSGTLNIGASTTSTSSSHYFIATGSDGIVRPKTLANVRSEIVTLNTINAAISGNDLTFTLNGSTPTGLILTAPGGSQFRITVEADGSLKSTPL